MELVVVFEEATADLIVVLIAVAKSDVGSEHGRLVLLSGVVGVRDDFLHRVDQQRHCMNEEDNATHFRIFCNPLTCTGRALRQLPLELVHIFEIMVTPLCGSLGPSNLQPTRDGMWSFAGLVLIPPAEALFFETRRLWLCANVLGRCGTMRLTERMTACNEGNYARSQYSVL